MIFTTNEKYEQALLSTLGSHKGACPVYLELTCPDGTVMTMRADDGEFGTSPSPEMVASVEAILGQGSVRTRGRRAGGARRVSAQR